MVVVRTRLNCTHAPELCKINAINRIYLLHAASPLPGGARSIDTKGNVKREKSAMANKAKPAERVLSGLTGLGELYVPGDALPQPDVVEKNSDSVWALWSDVVEGEVVVEGESESPPDQDFSETAPMDFESMDPTQLMDLPELPKDNKK